jgi:hypothetical protein
VMKRGLSAVVRVNGPVALLIVVAIFLSATKLLVAERQAPVWSTSGAERAVVRKRVPHPIIRGSPKWNACYYSGLDH